MARHSPQALEEARRYLPFLESIDWAWDLLTLKKQPGDLMEALIDIKMLGEAIRDNAEDPTETPPTQQ